MRFACSSIVRLTTHPHTTQSANSAADGTYTISSDSTCLRGLSRTTTRDNEVTVQWVPAHSTVAGSKKADEFAKAAASQSAPRKGMPDQYR